MARKTVRPLLGKLAPDDPFFGIVKDAYRVFRYPTPDKTGVCENCCMDPRVEADFWGPDIHEMPLHYVRDWYNAACEPEGVSQAVWGYLLPRVLEILASGQDVADVGKEVSLARFASGRPKNWSKAQWDVLDRFQRAYLERDARAGTSVLLDDTLCMFALGGWPLEALFQQITDLPDDVLAQRFWLDWCDWGLSGREAIWITAFWPDGLKDRVVGFYAAPELHARMEALALSDQAPDDVAQKASAVAQVIEHHSIA